MDARPFDVRTISLEPPAPDFYVVIFWNHARTVSDEWKLNTSELAEVMTWVDERAHGRDFEIMTHCEGQFIQLTTSHWFAAI